MTEFFIAALVFVLLFLFTRLVIKKVIENLNIITPYIAILCTLYLSFGAILGFYAGTQFMSLLLTLIMGGK